MIRNTPLPKLLIAEDQEYNLKIILKHLKDAPYELVTAMDGATAWDLLKNNAESYSAALLDRGMPELDGMELLAKMKDHKVLKQVPVIFQTAMDHEDEILEGIQAGAHYYLTKPYKKNILKTVVKSAIQDFERYKRLQAETQETISAIAFMQSGVFEIKTLAEGHKLSTFLAHFASDPTKLVVGLWELIANGVEHGNAGITYDEKSILNEQNEMRKEVKRRLALPENVNKKVTVAVTNDNDRLTFLIKDEGKGFEWEKYLGLSPERAFDNHGRGIAMAGMLAFSTIEYRGRGNEVLAILNPALHP